MELFREALYFHEIVTSFFLDFFISPITLFHFSVSLGGCLTYAEGNGVRPAEFPLIVLSDKSKGLPRASSVWASPVCTSSNQTRCFPREKLLLGTVESGGFKCAPWSVPLKAR